jgi:WhiB family redox-sensing transcriptional regulator
MRLDDCRAGQDPAMAMTTRLPPPLMDAYDWQSQGACRQAASGLFFDSDAKRGARRALQEEAAKQVCRQCPVMAQCRAHGLACEDYGIWGGLTAKERSVLRAGGSVDDSAHAA